MLAVFAMVCTFLPSPEVLNIFWCLLVSSFLVCFEFMLREVKLTLYACKPMPYGQLTTALVPNVPSSCFLRQSATIAKHFGGSFVLICFVIGELLSEVGSWVGHGLVLACTSMCFASLFRQFFNNIQDKRNTVVSYM